MNDLKRMGICPWYFARCVVLKYQDLEPEKVSRYYPVDVRVTRLIHGENELISVPLKTPRDLPHFFDPSCERCMGAFVESIDGDHHFIHARSVEDIQREETIRSEIIHNPLKDFAVSYVEGFEKKYVHARYLDLDLLMMASNGFVNASKLCEKFGTEFKLWTRTKSASELIVDKLESILEAKQTEISQLLQGTHLHLVKNTLKLLQSGSNYKSLPKEVLAEIIIQVKANRYGGVVTGTYIHPDLVLDLAYWISLPVRKKVRSIVQNYLTALKREEDSKILAENIRLTQEVSKVHNENQSLKSMIEDLKRQNEKIIFQNTQTHSQLNHVVTTVDSAKNYILANHVTPSEFAGKEHLLILLKNKGWRYEYTILRVMRENKDSCLKKHRLRCPYAKIKLEIQSANSMNLWNRIRQELIDMEFLSDIKSIHFNLRSGKYIHDLHVLIENVRKVNSIPLYTPNRNF